MPGMQYQKAFVPMLGKGSLMLDIFDPTTGLPTGLQHLGNVTKFDLDMKDDIAEQYSSVNKTVTLIASALKKRQAKVAITGTDFSSDHMAIVMMSSGKTALVTTATTFTSETLITAAQAPLAIGRYFKIANVNIDNVTTPPVLTSNSVTLVAGTDYKVVDAQLGIIYIPVGSSIATHAVTITYHTLAGSQDQVAGATVPFQQAHLLFDPDPVDGQKIACDVWRVNLNPNGNVGLIADDYGNWTLDGLVLDDVANHPNSPYFLQTFF
jgi:hypothetical protein